MSAGKCKGCGCAPGPGDADGAGDGPPPPEGALYVYSKSIIVPKGSQEQSLFTLPPAAAVDVFIRYRDPTSTNASDPTDGNTRFILYATQRLLSYKLDSNLAANLSTANPARILGVRDLPVDKFELKVDGLTRVDGNVGYYDVVVVGWGTEPTSLGPFPLSEWVEGQLIPPFGRTVGLPMMAAQGGSPGGSIVVVISGVDAVAAPYGLNTLPVGEFLSAPPTRTNGQVGPLMTDAQGNLKVAISSGGSTPATTRFVSAAYEASHVRAGAATMRAAFASSKAAAAGFLFIFDAAALPANGTVPDFPPVPIPAGPSFVSLDVAEGRPMTNGIVLAFSSTQATLTLSTADCWFEAHF